MLVCTQESISQLLLKADKIKIRRGMTLEVAPSEESLDNSVKKTWYAILNLQIVWLSYWKPNVVVGYTTAISKAPRSSNSY